MAFSSTSSSVFHGVPSEVANYGAFAKDSLWNHKYFPVFHRYSQVAPNPIREVNPDVWEADFLETLLANVASEAFKYLMTNSKTLRKKSTSAFDKNQNLATSKIHEEEDEITQVSTLGKRVAFLTGWLVWPLVVPFVVLIGAGIAVFIWYNFIK